MGYTGRIEGFTRWEQERGGGLAVNNAVPVAVCCSVSPNPTTGVITLQYPGAKPGTPLSVRITDASGQPVHAEKLSMQGSSQQIRLGPEAVPGTYYFSVFDAKGALICTKPVVKL